MSYNNVNVNVSGPVQPTSTYKTKVLKGNHSFASQVTEPNTKYVIKYDFTLGEDITIPANCILEFDGGSISGSHSINGVILNDVVKPEWFGAIRDGVTDCSNAVQNAFNVCRNGGTFLFSDGSYAFHNVTIRRNCTIKGSRNSILVGQPLVAGLNGFDYLFKAENIDDVSFIGFTVTGETPVPQGITAQTNNPLFYLNNGKQVRFDSVLFDSVSVRRPSTWTYGSGNGVVLYGILDYDKTVINNCEFKDCTIFSQDILLTVPVEMTWIAPILKERNDLEVIYTNNHIHNTNGGATTLFDAVCGKLLIDNNLITGFGFTGSALNCFGYNTTITNNTIKDCYATSVFDTAEGGTVYSNKVFVENNIVECLNSVMVFAATKYIFIKNNIFKGLSFLVVPNSTEHESDPSSRSTHPIGELIEIDNNDIDCNNYSSSKTLPGKDYRSGISVLLSYCLGENITISNNNISCVYDSSFIDAAQLYFRRVPFYVRNMNKVIVINNKFNNAGRFNGSSSYPIFGFIGIKKESGISYDIYGDRVNKIDSIILNDNIYINDVNPSPSFVSIVADKDSEYLDIKYVHNSSNSVFLFTRDNVGVLKYVGPKKTEITSAYATDCAEINSLGCGYISSGIISNIDGSALLATQNTCITDHDSGDTGTAEKGSIVSFGTSNWQTLKQVTLSADLGPSDDSTPVGSIKVFDSVAWRRCPNRRNAIKNLSN